MNQNEAVPTSPNANEVSAVKALAERYGETRAAKLLHVNHITLARFAAGFRLRPSSFERIAKRLVELKALAPESASPR